MKVCFIYSDRSEYSILKPFIDYFQRYVNTRSVDLSKHIINLHEDKNLFKVYKKSYEILSSEKFDYLCILGDRRELPFIALAAFFLEIKIIHIAAGEFVDETPTYDQILRPAVTLLSSFQICFSKKAENKVRKLFAGTEYLSANSYTYGNPVFKGITPHKIGRIVDGSYDLVLLHPQSLSRKETIHDVQNVKKLLKDKKTIFISGNKDRNSEIIENFYHDLKRKKCNYIFYDSLPKERYFSYVKYCDNFYTNSSSISEIKFLNKNCLRLIGKRNKGRSAHRFNDKSPELLYMLLRKYSR